MEVNFAQPVKARKETQVTLGEIRMVLSFRHPAKAIGSISVTPTGTAKEPLFPPGQRISLVRVLSKSTPSYPQKE